VWKVSVPPEKWETTYSFTFGCGRSGVTVIDSLYGCPFHSAVKLKGQRISQPEVLAMVRGRQR
jgi:hypothetical protein